MIRFPEHFFTFTINNSSIANLHNSLGHAPFSSLYSQLLLAEAEAEAYCRQPAGTLNPGTGPRWDPWPYLCLTMNISYCCHVFKREAVYQILSSNGYPRCNKIQ
jgi:hypothetical protein